MARTYKKTSGPPGKKGVGWGSVVDFEALQSGGQKISGTTLLIAVDRKPRSEYIDLEKMGDLSH
ncbi:uncharacterized protein Z518_09570 [Rhinocladiella mackenziei CBS 650.93]|uniref:Rhinocladiella mackenziei CBS 650.93 unplaced genomic scaffold supercont1.7, whole genome shotgun sequence n=1 Tax=Rhinocladiella mackenziei CBS 650.93 TaxID=1442369 RepID=A0A0D2GU30_9EURO|nr:uncharacterized protein Z518_09570 [Rhinocladiella mackenziei CBS 650.93]KIX01843.1 hypothetical protein Z518_09570 [Rhinocladiella mackenziei CBS 650.93]